MLETLLRYKAPAMAVRRFSAKTCSAFLWNPCFAARHTGADEAGVAPSGMPNQPPLWWRAAET